MQGFVSVYGSKLSSVGKRLIYEASRMCGSLIELQIECLNNFYSSRMASSGMLRRVAVVTTLQRCS
jgi:hypothetical protein